MATEQTASVVVTVAQALPRIDVTCYAGRPFELTVSLLDADGEAMPAAAITAVRAQVRPGIDSDQVLHSFDSDDDPQDAVVSNGQVVLTATSEVTTEWGDLWPGRAPATVAWWDVELTDTDDVVWQMTEPGTFTVIHQVTR